ncbi:MAG: ATP-binding protein [Pseudomonadota bacterium]
MEATSLDRQQLKVAFESFSQHSDQLEQSYRDLQFKVEALTRALNSEQSARLREFRNTERLSKRLAQLLESLPGGIVVIDGEGQIQQHNSEAARLLGRPLLGCSWASIVKREVHGGGTEDGNILLRDGQWLSLSRRALRNEAGEVILLADVTDSRQISELRQRQERLSAIGEMTAEFAHQVRTPLASAMLYAAQLDTATPTQQRAVQKISERLNDLGRMVDDMLQFAAGTRTNAEIVNVADLVSTAVAAVDGQLAERTKLSFVVQDPSLTVSGNADALRGAIVNLVTNADQAALGAMRIVISARRADDTLVIAVSDDGPGVPEEFLARLFEPFFTTRPQGTGLGLAVVQQVAAAHDGTAKVASSKLGTTFTIELPLVEAA